MKTADLYARMAELIETGTPFAVATVVDVRGSSPRAVGASMLVLQDGSTLGTIGGRVLEHQATHDALERLRTGVSGIESYRLTQSGDGAIGARCGGEAHVFFDVHTARESLLILGAGHIGQKLCALAGMLDYRITVVDSRPDLASRSVFPLRVSSSALRVAGSRGCAR